MSRLHLDDIEKYTEKYPFEVLGRISNERELVWMDGKQAIWYMLAFHLEDNGHIDRIAWYDDRMDAHNLRPTQDMLSRGIIASLRIKISKGKNQGYNMAAHVLIELLTQEIKENESQGQDH